MSSSKTLVAYRKSRGRCTRCYHVLSSERRAAKRVTCADCSSMKTTRPSVTAPCNRCGKAPRYSNSPYCKRCRTHNTLKRLYGITIGEYEGLLAAQNGACAICKGGPFSRRLAVDHDHKTGLIRGLLCYPCNRGLPWFCDDPERLRGAAQYMEATF